MTNMERVDQKLQSEQIIDPSDFLTAFEDESPDALSDLFDCVRCEAFTYNVTRFEAPWCLNNCPVADATAYYIAAGAVRLSAGPDNCVDLHQGDSAIVMPNLRHKLQSLGPNGETVIGRTAYGLDVARAQPLLRSLPPFLVLRGATDDIQEHVALAYMTAKLRDDSERGNKALMRRLTEALFIFSILAYRRKQAQAAPFDPSNLRIAPSLQAIHRHPEVDWTLSMLATEAGLSRSLFCTEFASTIGDTPKRYLTRVRLLQASELLRHSNLSLAAVAFRVGYSGEVTLGRAFKRFYGVTLGEFRTAARRRKSADVN